MAKKPLLVQKKREIKAVEKVVEKPKAKVLT